MGNGGWVRNGWQSSVSIKDREPVNDWHLLSPGLEMDEEDSSYTDGTFRTDRFFSCAPNRALFIPLSRCKLDSRFQDVVDGAIAIDNEVRLILSLVCTL